MRILLQFSGQFFILLLISLFFSQCVKEEGDLNIKPLFENPTNYSNEIALSWNAQMQDLERYTPGYKSPIAARTLAYTNLAAYESIVQAMPNEFNSIADKYLQILMPKIQPKESYFWPVVMNSAYKFSIQHYYKTAPIEQQLQVIQLYDKLHKEYSAQIDPSIIARSIEFGQSIASTIYEWSKTDVVGSEAYRNITDPNYVLPLGEGFYKPTYPDFLAPILPNWGNVRNFVSKGASLDIPAPFEYSTDPQSPMYKQAKYVRDLTESIRDNKQSEEYWMAEFWSDDFSTVTFTPAGRWAAIAGQVIKQENSNMADAAMIYAKVSIALCDAGIGAWQNKYKYNVLRPVDYIRANIDANWNTILTPDLLGKYYTPQDPSYPSEHATYGAATAGVLAEIFGDQYTLTDRCHEGRLEFRSDPRTFYSFSSMAKEVAYSRMPLGVHLQEDGDAGLLLGAQIAVEVNKMQFKK